MNPEKLSCEVQHCIDVALDSRIPYSKNKIYWELLTSYDLRLGEIINNPERFTTALADILGRGLALGIERAIVKEMRNRFRLAPLDTYRFADALSASRRVHMF